MSGSPAGCFVPLVRHFPFFRVSAVTPFAVAAFGVSRPPSVRASAPTVRFRLPLRPRWFPTSLRPRWFPVFPRSGRLPCRGVLDCDPFGPGLSAVRSFRISDPEWAPGFDGVSFKICAVSSRKPPFQSLFRPFSGFGIPDTLKCPGPLSSPVVPCAPVAPSRVIRRGR